MRKTFASTIARLLPAVIATVGASAAYAQSYTGDPDFVGAISCERNTLVSQAQVYENVALPSGRLRKIFGHFAFSTNAPIPTQAYWEIRRGIGNGQGGTMMAGGTVAITSCTQVGWMAGIFPLKPELGPPLAPGVRVYRVEVDGLAWQGSQNVPYQVTLCPIGAGAGRYYICSTSGANGYGSYLNDKQSWLDSIFWTNLGWSYSWTDSATYYSNAGVDFSLGVDGP